MSSSNNPHHHDDEHVEEDDLLNNDEIAEEYVPEDGDVAMDSDDEEGGDIEEQEINLQNDSIAYFDKPQDSLFTIAQHPVHRALIAVGGSAGEEDDAPGAGWIFDTSSAPSRPVLPASFAADSQSASNRSTTELDSLFSLEGHTDSINTLTWTLPHGEVLLSGGLDGRLRAWKTDIIPAPAPNAGLTVSLLAEAQEVPEINWLSPCPSPDQPNTVALGSSDGSIWVYRVDPSDPSNALQIVQSYFMTTAPSTAGAWTPDGKLLATIAEDSSLYVWDVFGAAADANITSENGMTVVAMTAEDQRFEVEGGLYSIAIDPKGGWVAVGGAGGNIRIVSLPRLSSSTQSASQSRSKGGKGAPKSGGDATAGGVILAALQTQTDSVEALAVSVTPTSPPTTLLAAGSVDGSIVLYDATRRFAVRRNMQGAHEEHSVVKLEFVKNSWILTSCGMDGVVRRWDLRGGGVTPNNAPGAAAADAGLIKEWKGHRGDGEGGGVLGFVQGETGERVVTAGDDGVSLVFEA